MDPFHSHATHPVLWPTSINEACTSLSTISFLRLSGACGRRNAESISIHTRNFVALRPFQWAFLSFLFICSLPSRRLPSISIPQVPSLLFTVMSLQPCPDKVQNGVCLRQGCRFDHNVRRCVPCGTNIPMSQMVEHVQSGSHRERVAAQAAPSSQPSRAPPSNGVRTPTTASQPQPPRQPPQPAPAQPPPVPNRAPVPNSNGRTPRPPSHQRTVSGVSICNICNLHVRTEDLEAHIRQHSRSTPSSAPGSNGTSRTSAAKPAPQSDEPLPLGKRRCEACNELVWKSRWMKHLKSESHRRKSEGDAGPGDSTARGDRDGGIEADIQVSHIDGRDFETVERDSVTETFPTTTLDFSVTKRRPQASFSLRRVDITPVDDLDPAAAITQRYAFDEGTSCTL